LEEVTDSEMILIVVALNGDSFVGQCGIKQVSLILVLDYEYSFTVEGDDSKSGLMNVKEAD
jgi:hypothetical protein